MTGAEAYHWVHEDARLDAFCFTAVAGGEREQVIGGFLGDRETETLSTFDDAFNGFPSPSYVLVDAVPGGVLAAENNGWQGVQEDVARSISTGGTLAAFYRNVNAVMAFMHAVDGVVRSWFDPLLDEVPPELSEQAVGLDFGDLTESSAFALLERLTGIRLDEEWLVARHSRFDVPSPV